MITVYYRGIGQLSASKGGGGGYGGKYGGNNGIGRDKGNAFNNSGGVIPGSDNLWLWETGDFILSENGVDLLASESN